MGRRVSRRLPRDVDRHARPRAANCGCSRWAPSPTACARARGWTATCTRASFAARAWRWRSPRTCCGCTSSRPARQASKLSERRGRALRDVRFYVLPRMSPDGAEAVHDHGPLRALAFRATSARHKAHAYWRGERRRRRRAGAVDARPRSRRRAGRVRREFPGCCCRARSTTRRRTTRSIPRASSRTSTATNVPSPYFLSDNQTDLNRNFPYAWAPDAKQEGAGAFPLSEVESRAVVDFATQHPEIFLWLNLHTFGGVFIRPLGDKPDTKMNQQDLALYRQLGAWAEELTGYPMVSGCRGVPLRARHAAARRPHRLRLPPARRGRVRRRAVGPLQAGGPRAQEALRRQLHAPDARGHAEDRARGTATRTTGRTLLPWRKFNHPQLGEVEVGGIDPRVGMWNPPPSEMPGVCTAQSAHFLRTAALAPAVVVDAVETQDAGRPALRASR